MIDNRFYVYIYLNPLKPGKFNYGEYSFDFEPFYVGYGQGKRKFDHLIESKRNKYSHKLNTIRKIFNKNFQPIILTIKENLFENDAKILEIKTIFLIGRKDIKKGPLSNLTDGGDGVSGINHKGCKNSMFNKKHSINSKMEISKTRKERFKLGLIIPTKHTDKWKQILKNKYAINDKLIIKLNQEGKTTKEISKVVSLSTKSIRERLYKYDLKTNNPQEKIIIDIEEVHKYILMGLNYKEIGKILNISSGVISRNYRNSKFYTHKRSKWDSINNNNKIC